MEKKTEALPRGAWERGCSYAFPRMRELESDMYHFIMNKNEVQYYAFPRKTVGMRVNQTSCFKFQAKKIPAIAGIYLYLNRVNLTVFPSIARKSQIRSRNEHEHQIRLQRHPFELLSTQHERLGLSLGHI